MISQPSRSTTAATENILGEENLQTTSTNTSSSTPETPPTTDQHQSSNNREERKNVPQPGPSASPQDHLPEPEDQRSAHPSQQSDDEDQRLKHEEQRPEQKNQQPDGTDELSREESHLSDQEVQQQEDLQHLEDEPPHPGERVEQNPEGTPPTSTTESSTNNEESEDDSKPEPIDPQPGPRAPQGHPPEHDDQRSVHVDQQRSEHQEAPGQFEILIANWRAEEQPSEPVDQHDIVDNAILAQASESIDAQSAELPVDDHAGGEQAPTEDAVVSWITHLQQPPEAPEEPSLPNPDDALICVCLSVDGCPHPCNCPVLCICNRRRRIEEPAEAAIDVVKKRFGDFFVIF